MKTCFVLFILMASQSMASDNQYVLGYEHGRQEAWNQATAQMQEERSKALGYEERLSRCNAAWIHKTKNCTWLLNSYNQQCLSSDGRGG